jgi:hypothetical protein
MAEYYNFFLLIFGFREVGIFLPTEYQLLRKDLSLIHEVGEKLWLIITTNFILTGGSVLTGSEIKQFATGGNVTG